MVQKQPVLIAEVELLEDPEDDSVEVIGFLRSIFCYSSITSANDTSMLDG